MCEYAHVQTNPTNPQSFTRETPVDERIYLEVSNELFLIPLVFVTLLERLGSNVSNQNVWLSL